MLSPLLVVTLRIESGEVHFLQAACFRRFDAFAGRWYHFSPVRLLDRRS